MTDARKSVAKCNPKLETKMRGSGMNNGQAESIAAIAAKAAPPITVSFATIGGVQVSEILLWATLIYTLMMIGHKAFAIWKDVFRGGRGARR